MVSTPLLKVTLSPECFGLQRALSAMRSMCRHTCWPIRSTRRAIGIDAIRPPLTCPPDVSPPIRVGVTVDDTAIDSP